MRWGEIWTVHLHNLDISLPLHSEQPPLNVLRVVRGEARLDAPREVPDAGREVGEEELRLVALQFSVLDWASTQNIVQSHSQQGGTAWLVLTGLAAQPEVNVPPEYSSVLGSRQHNEGIPNMELSILILFVGDSFEILEVTIDLRDREIEMFPTSILQICSPADCPAPSNAIVVSVMIANTDQHSFYRQQYLDKTQPTTPPLALFHKIM